MGLGQRRLRALGVWAVAATVSGAPSTLWALAAGDDPLRATRAAGTLLPGRRDRPGPVAGVAAHVAVSAWWTAVLCAAARRHQGAGPTRIAGGAVAGLAIAVLDLELVGRRYPHLRSLPRVPQLLDHAAFGAVVGALCGPRSAGVQVAGGTVGPPRE
ncbi:hypothetical protein [Jiangella asiatica]|uniref:hypothetical protein n=1 Tax=Jiangella asiatica TaxID=2530372 RepID=UPI00193D6808|nr:hypothetical protein [Jiangella asiatica]